MKKNKLFIVGFITPCILALVVMYLYPVVRTVIMSFFKIESVTSSASEWSFNGLANYAKVFSSPTFQRAATNILIIWLLGGIIILSFSLLFSVIITGLKNFSVQRFIFPILSAPWLWLPCGFSISTIRITVSLTRF